MISAGVGAFISGVPKQITAVWIKMAEMRSFTGLETRSLRSRTQQGRALSEYSSEGQPAPASGCQQSLASVPWLVAV